MTDFDRLKNTLKWIGANYSFYFQDKAHYTGLATTWKQSRLRDHWCLVAGDNFYYFNKDGKFVVRNPIPMTVKEQHSSPLEGD